MAESTRRLAPGPLNALTDVAGLAVGQAEAPALVSGTTVVLAERPVMASAAVGGGGPGTRAVSAAALGGTVQRIDAVALSGGSAFGLDAAGGVMDALRRRNRGFAIGPARVPIVPGAIIFDLLTGTADAPTGWETPPWWDLARAATEHAGETIRQGNAGAGLGATAGPIKGGTGTASLVAEGAEGRLTVGALAIANPLGLVTMPGTTAFWAHPFERGREFGAIAPPPMPMPLPDFDFERYASGANTTLAVVATDAGLSHDECHRVALMAHDGLARAIRPVHTPLDGDTVFALATGPGERAGAALTGRVGMMAADCLARAVARAVYHAEAIAGIPAWRDLGPDGCPAVRPRG
ncbi:MAG: P1 family peptidase [Pseudomonadota bacterium]